MSDRPYLEVIDGGKPSARVPDSLFPHKIETALIGAMITDRTFNPVIGTECFSSPAARAAYEALLVDRMVDETLIADQAKIPLAELLDWTSRGYSALGDRYVDQIRKAATCRRVLAFETELGLAARARDVELLGSVLAQIQDTLDEDEPERHSDLKTQADEILFRLFETVRPPAITTGLTDLNQRLSGGIAPDQYVILGARTRVGKTALLTDMARAAAKAGAKVLLYSCEMGEWDLVCRLYSAEARVALAKIRAGDFDETEARDLTSAAARLADPETGSLAYQAPRGRNVDRLLSAAVGYDLVLIDYAQLLDAGDTTIPKTERCDAVSKAVSRFVRETKTPVVLAAQLNREAEGRAPRIEDIQWSSAFEQDADIVLLIEREAAIDTKADPTAATIHVAKNRNGMTGPVEVSWLGSYTSFTDRRQTSFDWMKES